MGSFLEMAAVYRMPQPYWTRKLPTRATRANIVLGIEQYRHEEKGVKQTRVAIYTRVSTDDQSTKTQEHELRQYAKNRGWTVQRVYTDHGFSGASEKRPALDELLRDTRKRKFDVVLVWKFDRFARSLRQLVSALELFRKFGIDFVSATEALVFQIFGAIAQFERALIGERVRAGLGEARRNGKRIGRPPIRSLTHEERTRMRMEHRKGKSLRKLAGSYGVTLWTAHSACHAGAARYV